MQTSAIGWTDYSGGIWNIVTGCTPVDRGCAHCYARAIYQRFGREFGKVEIHPDKLAAWRTAKLPQWSPKRGEGHLPMVFVVDMGDLFHPEVPTEFIHGALDAMQARPDVAFQLLTKRPERMARELADWQGDKDRLPPNIWVGASVCDQETLDARLALLSQVAAQVRFLSVEPMLGPVSLRAHLGPVVEWVICGAESGPERRPFERDWAQALYDECWWYGIPFFGKQDSGPRPGRPLRLEPPGLDEERVVQQWPTWGA